MIIYKECPTIFKKVKEATGLGRSRTKGSGSVFFKDDSDPDQDSRNSWEVFRQYLIH